MAKEIREVAASFKPGSRWDSTIRVHRVRRVPPARPRRGWQRVFRSGRRTRVPPSGGPARALPRPTGRHRVAPMPPDGMPRRRSALLSFQFVGTAMAGSLTMGLVCALAPPAAQLAALGALVSIVAGLFVAYMGQEAERERRRADLMERLSVPLTLAAAPDLYAEHRDLSQALLDLAARDDPVLRGLAVLKLASVTGQIRALAAGEVVFPATEAWRTVYEQLLTSPDIRSYRSVAWVRAPGYWQDPPGRQSMKANYDATRRGMLVERVVILRDDLWPVGTPLPTGDVLAWIEDQHRHGVWVTLVRESELAGEPDLLVDSGIYGDRAVGVQELDEHGRTLRFILRFDPAAVRLALDRWDRLALFAVSYQSLLDRLPPNG